MNKFANSRGIEEQEQFAIHDCLYTSTQLILGKLLENLTMDLAYADLATGNTWTTISNGTVPTILTFGQNLQATISVGKGMEWLQYRRFCT